MSGDQYSDHNHSESDRTLPYFRRPSANFQAPCWTPLVQRYDLGEFSTPSGGTRPGSSIFAQCNERRSAAGVSSVSNSLAPALSPSESSRLTVLDSKRPTLSSPRNFSGRHSFISEPVYPLVFRNPVSGEAFGFADEHATGRTTPGNNNRASPVSNEDTSSSEFKSDKTLTELRKMEASPEPGMSSRREGLSWSNASSYDFGFDEETTNIKDHIGLENPRATSTSARYQKCGICERLLWQKSPWSSQRIVRSGDMPMPMPIVGILPCGHVFHAECLEETTLRGHIHDPPCPVCLKIVGSGGSNGEGSSSTPNPDQTEGSLKHRQSLPVIRRGGPLMKNHFKKRFNFLQGKDRI